MTQPATLLPDPTWLVGCGNMAGAIVAGWRAANLDLSGLVVIRPSGTPVEGVRTVATLGEAGRQPALVILGIKPQKLDEVAPEVNRWITSKTVVASMLAGVEVASLRQRFPRAAAIMRVMPNLPVAIRRGVVGLYGDATDEVQRLRFEQPFAALGYARWATSEEELAAVGAVAGAGPAYVARFIAALAKAGEARGLAPAMAQTIARETVLGTGWLAATTNEEMGALAGRVASPGGTTEAGLAILDDALDRLVGETIDAAAQRGRDLAAQARLA